MTFETDDNYSIQFEISNNSSTVQFDLIRNEKKTIRTALLVLMTYMCLFVQCWVDLCFRKQ